MLLHLKYDAVVPSTRSVKEVVDREMQLVNSKFISSWE